MENRITYDVNCILSHHVTLIKVIRDNNSFKITSTPSGDGRKSYIMGAAKLLSLGTGHYLSPGGGGGVGGFWAKHEKI